MSRLALKTDYVKIEKSPKMMKEKSIFSNIFYQTSN